MTSLAGRRYSYQDYLDVEDISEIRHEYLDGEIFAMAGGTPEHAALAGAIIGMLYPHLREGPGRAFSSDLRIRVEASGLSTYPDVAIVCGPLERSTKDANAVINPTILVEVLSPSTEAYDREDKRLHYQEIPSVQVIVLVQSVRPEVEVWRRGDRSFRQETYGPLDVVPLVGELRLELAELYRSIEPRS